MKGNPVYIVATKRTPIGSLNGSLSSLRGPELAMHAIKGAIEQINLNPTLIDEVILGNVCSAGEGQNPARQAALLAGLPSNIPCTNVNKVCASGMKSVMFGCQSIQLGQSEIVVCGGFESMSNVPFYVPNYRKGHSFGNQTLIDGLQYDGLTNFYDNKAMGYCAEKTAKDFNINREENDQFCHESYEKALKAQKNELFKDEIIPIKVKDQIINQDQEPQKYNKNKISQLKPVFTQEGTITAANASKINDGSCIISKKKKYFFINKKIVLMSQNKMNELKLKPLAQILSYADAEVEPVDFCIAPAKSGQKALYQANLQLSQVDYFEFNEAFATTVLANIRLLKINQNRVNVNGGGVALGHPIGMSGARIIQSLISVLKQNNGQIGMAGICNGGGGGSTIVIKNIH
ncbi:hypothetical protein IMG5_017510 [Ichthyophthirius multifiliis]|uniref:Acetyl-CoA C-acetyltransferase n=1 Tax=Ichthyophthirius multifiliis TaxID=5932 RepID=G0QKG4_ICHMU|nr:hypothetical protein IMG5_017510 [Ichthyophthirius multifiliis]EGR34286.1 hypothetical protein IMG5_017510 [Ichthyophthirius multifiliis]|eukprot:XP_004039590.1 hypothetical protein IMG5_017510 [Ichthyophthirius multifiliis]